MCVVNMSGVAANSVIEVTWWRLMHPGRQLTPVLVGSCRSVDSDDGGGAAVAVSWRS